MVGELPIEAVRGELEAAWRENAMVVLSAPTGSGKSTCVPRWLARKELVDTLEGESRSMVYVVEPRRVACRALALYLARQSGGRVGDEVGYAVRFDTRVSAKTRLCFVTPGVALRLLASGELLKRGHTLMLDEFHERSAELDLLAAAGRTHAANGKLRLLFCSATLDVEGLAGELNAATVKAEGRSYPVDIEYRGEGGPSEEDLEERVASAVEDALKRFEGDVLVFLPGRAAIRHCMDRLRGRAKADLVEVHGGVPPERLAEAFEGGAGRRVYLSTNVAESSVTLPGVRCVIDSGLVKRVLHRAGRSLLALERVAMDSADQRAGRAGRVAAGNCWRLWGRGFGLEAQTPPEIAGIELDDFLVRAADLGLAGEAFDRAPWVSQPPVFAVESARARLLAAGVLDAQFHLSERGRSFAGLPVSAQRAALLLDAPEKLRADVADLVARLEVDRPLTRRGGSDRVDEARAELLADARDEVEVEIALLRKGEGRRHGVDPRTLAETRKVAVALREAIGATPSSPSDSPALLQSRDELIRHVLERAPAFAFAKRPRQRKSRGPRRSEAWANDEGVELSLRGFEHPAGDEGKNFGADAQVGLVFGARWIGVGRRARGIGLLLMPAQVRDFMDAGLGTLEVGEPRIEQGRGRRRVCATTGWRFASLSIESKGGELSGPALREALTALVMRGGFYPALGDALREQALLRDMLVTQSPFADAEDPTQGLAAEAWLLHRLDNIGVESNEDLQLVEEDDLCMPLETWATKLVADPTLLSGLRKDFPFEFVDRDAAYRLVRVNLDRRRVVLHPVNALAKKRGEPATKLLPRFRGFSVFFEQASRRIKLR